MTEIKKKILTVDDEDSVRIALRNEFDSKKFQVLEAKDGEEGLAIALAEHPDLILVDYVMPKIDGIHFLEKLRTNQWGKSTKVFMLTNIPSPEKKRASEALGAEFLLKSDWKLADLVKKCEQAISG